MVVYVDSGSVDGSPQYAASMNCQVVELDPARPFSAARARNEGFARVMEHAPDVPFIQFLDGDCDLVEGWLRQGVAALAAQRTRSANHFRPVRCSSNASMRPLVPGTEAASSSTTPGPTEAASTKASGGAISTGPATAPTDATPETASFAATSPYTATTTTAEAPLLTPPMRPERDEPSDADAEPAPNFTRLRSTPTPPGD